MGVRLQTTQGIHHADQNKERTCGPKSGACPSDSFHIAVVLKVELGVPLQQWVSGFKPPRAYTTRIRIRKELTVPRGFLPGHEE